MTDKELAAAAKALIEAGIQLNAIYEPIGCTFGLRPSDLGPFMRDRDQFFADECAVSKDEYRAWRRFMAEGRPCSHIGDRGPCRGITRDSRGLSPQDYARRRAEGSLVCGRHAPKAPR